MNVPKIDHDLCTRCGECIAICPKKVLEIEGDRVEPNVSECMLCSHCYSICPVDAVRFDRDALRNVSFSSFAYREEMVRPGSGDPSMLVNLIRSRRSIRRYTDREVPDEIIGDLIECAVTAPSGSNRQLWRFTAVNGRERVWNTALEIGKFFVKTNRMARNPVIRYGIVPFAGTALIRYYRDHYESVEMAIAEAEKGNDLLFHGAPALVIVHGEREGSTPVEDAQYASYNITLLAHLLGLGTCYIGYAVESINRSSAVRKSLGIPAHHRVHAVLALGYPAVAFRRPALRKPYGPERPAEQ